MKFKTPTQRFKLAKSSGEGLKGDKVKIKGNRAKVSSDEEGGFDDDFFQKPSNVSEFKFLNNVEPSSEEIDDVFASFAGESSKPPFGVVPKPDDNPQLKRPVIKKKPVPKFKLNRKPAPEPVLELPSSDDDDEESVMTPPPGLDEISSEDGSSMSSGSYSGSSVSGSESGTASESGSGSESGSYSSRSTRSSRSSGRKKSKSKKGKPSVDNPFGLSKEELVEAEKRDLLWRFNNLRSKGHKIPNFTMNSDLAQMRMTMGEIEHQREINYSKLQLQRYLVSATGVLEVGMSSKFIPKGLRGSLNGFGQHILNSMPEFDPIFEQMAEKEGGITRLFSTGNPTWDLFLAVGMSMLMFIQHRYTVGNHEPTEEDIQKRYPSLVKRVAMEEAEKMRKQEVEMARERFLNSHYSQGGMPAPAPRAVQQGIMPPQNRAPEFDPSVYAMSEKPKEQSLESVYAQTKPTGTMGKPPTQFSLETFAEQKTDGSEIKQQGGRLKI
nr:hypothetical protein [Sicyoidochytrium minutum DNA virus]